MRISLTDTVVSPADLNGPSFPVCRDGRTNEYDSVGRTGRGFNGEDGRIEDSGKILAKNHVHLRRSDGMLDAELEVGHLAPFISSGTSLR